MYSLPPPPPQFVDGLGGGLDAASCGFLGLFFPDALGMESSGSNSFCMAVFFGGCLSERASVSMAICEGV